MFGFSQIFSLQVIGVQIRPDAHSTGPKCDWLVRSGVVVLLTCPASQESNWVLLTSAGEFVWLVGSD